MRYTHTYVVLTVSPQTYAEISAKLHEAGYEQAFLENSEYGILIYMEGIALADEDAR